MSTLTKLLRYPHRAVFDIDPHGETALRFGHPGGAAWKVEDEVLTVQLGDDTLTYSLASYTVAQLAAALTADGLTVYSVSPSWASRSALVLVDGSSGDGALTMGDQVKAFTSLLWALYGGYARELRTAKRQIAEALKQLVITTAEGEWLDVWGKLYDVPRSGMDDADYAPTIPREAFRIRVNALAIELAIRELTGKDVRIDEPWRRMFRLDESLLSGGDCFYDGSTVGYHLIRPVSRRPIDFTDVLLVINRNRAAGIVVLQPEVQVGTLIEVGLGGVLSSGATSLATASINVWAYNLLDQMILSGEEPVRNWSSTSNGGTLGYTWSQMGKWTELPWSVTIDYVESLLGAVGSLGTLVDNTLFEDLG